MNGALSNLGIPAVQSLLPRMHVTTTEPGDTAPPRPRTDSLPPHPHHYPSILCLTSLEISPLLDYIINFEGNWLTGLRFDRIRSGITQGFQNALRTILCTCPNLVVFTALPVYFYLQNMDVNNLLEFDGSYRKADGGLPNWPPLQRRTVWACRNLRTLHISIAKQDNKDCARHESSLVIFGYLSLVCPRLEELSIRSEWMAMDDESGLCLLGRLRYLERLQLHSLPTLVYPDVFWLRRRKFGSGSPHPVDGEQHALMKETLLGRIIAESRDSQSGGVYVTDPSVYLKKLPPLPVFQEPKSFLTEDGVDLGSVGRPDALVTYVMNTNKDLMVDSDTSMDAWNRDAA